MSNYKTMAKRPKGKEYENVNMIDGVYGTHYYGVEFPDGKVYPEDKCEIMKSQKEELNDETKSPLDEFIENMLQDWFRSSGITTIDFIEKFVRLAVQKHAEAVIPEKIEMKHISDSSVALSNGVIEEIKSESDKWRGV